MSLLRNPIDKVRVLVADDNKEVRDKVVQMLSPSFNVIGTARDGKSVCEAVDMLRPEVVVLDVSMPYMDGIEAAKKMNRNGSKAKTVFLTVNADPDFVRAALKAGASAYVIKSYMATDLIAAMNAAVEDRVFVSPSCAWDTDKGTQ